MHAAAGFIIVAHRPHDGTDRAVVTHRDPYPVVLRDDLDVQRVIAPGIAHGVGDDLTDQQAGDLGVFLTAPDGQQLVDKTPCPPRGACVGGQIEACGKSFGHASPSTDHCRRARRRTSPCVRTSSPARYCRLHATQRLPSNLVGTMLSRTVDYLANTGSPLRVIGRYASRRTTVVAPGSGAVLRSGPGASGRWSNDGCRNTP